MTQARAGVLAVPTVVAEEVRTRHALHIVGEASDAVQHFFAITVERRPRHPAVAALLDAARAAPIG